MGQLLYGEVKPSLKGNIIEIMEIIFGIIVALLSLLLIVSPFVCLYWVYRPARRFLWRHKFISKIIGFGAAFGCILMITRGVLFLLWFIPDDLLLDLPGSGFDLDEEGQAWVLKLLVAALIGVVGTGYLWGKLEEAFREKQRVDREAGISFEKSRQERDLYAMDIDDREGMIAKFRRRKEELDKFRQNRKLNPFREEELIALEQVLEEWDEQEDSLS